MLARTGADVGSSVDLFTMVGYRNYPDGAMQEVQALLDGIVREAVDAE